MVKKILFSILLILLMSTTAEAQTNNQRHIEIFDISQERVVKRIPVTRDIQENVKQLIENTTSVYPKVQPIPERGYIVKVPFEKPHLIHNRWFHGYVDRVYLIFPPGERPYYLVLDPNNRAHLYNFEGDTRDLVKKLRFKPLSGERPD